MKTSNLTPLKTKLLALLLPFAAILLAGQLHAADDPWSESVSLEYKGQYAKAAALIEPQLEGPHKEYANIRYAWLNYLLGNYNDAIRYYGKAAKLNPHSIDAWLGFTLPLLAQQRYKEAQRTAQKVLKIAPWNHTAHVRVIQSLEGQKDWEQMRKRAANLFKQYPTSSDAIVYLARAYAWQGKTSAAVKAYQQALVLYPGHYEASAYVAKNG